MARAKKKTSTPEPEADAPLTTRFRVRLDFTVEVDGQHVMPDVFAKHYKLLVYLGLRAMRFGVDMRLLRGSSCRCSLAFADRAHRERYFAAFRTHRKPRPGEGMILPCIDGSWGDALKDDLSDAVVTPDYILIKASKPKEKRA